MARAKSTKASKAAKSETRSQPEGETRPKSKAKRATTAKAQTKSKSAAAGRTKARREKPDVIGKVGPMGASAAETGFVSNESSGDLSGNFGGDFSADFTPGGAAAAAAAAVAEPASRYDGVLGQLTWNAELRSYRGRVDFKDRQVDLCLVVEDRTEALETMIGRAREVVNRLDEYADRAEAYAAAKLDEVERGVSAVESIGYAGEKESCCTGDGECAMPPAERSEVPGIARFNRAMRLKSIEFRPSGAVTFLHDDGNAFWGHLIEVTMNTDDQLTDARLAA